MQRHVTFSYDLAASMQGITNTALAVVNEHHERIDGSGYPHHLHQDNLSIYGQMAAIVDIYDAITTDRVYCEGISSAAALKKLLEWGKEQFNQDLVQRFIHCVGIYPIGSLVALSDGRFAVVIESSKKGLLQPKVRAIFDSIKRQYSKPEDIDLAELHDFGKLTIVNMVDAKKWRIRPQDFLDYTHL